MRYEIGQQFLEHFTGGNMGNCSECPDLMRKVNEIYHALITGPDGKRGIVERLRVIEEWKNKLRSTTRTVILLIITNICVLAAQFIPLIFDKG